MVAMTKKGVIIMKQYHEYASVVDESDKLVGFLLCDTGTGEYQYADFNLFFTLVKQNKVQYFVFDEQNQLKIEYSDEELKSFRKVKNVVDSFQTLDDYLQSDVKFYKEHLDLASKYSHICVGASMATPQAYLVGSMLCLMMPIIGIDYTELLEKLNAKKGIAATCSNALGCPAITIPMPLMVLSDDYVSLFEDCLFSTKALTDPPKVTDIENVKKTNFITKHVFKNNSDFSSLVTMKNFVDKINANTLRKYTSIEANCSTMNVF